MQVPQQPFVDVVLGVEHEPLLQHLQLVEEEHHDNRQRQRDQRRVRLDYQPGCFAARQINMSSLRIRSDTVLACGLLAETLRRMVDASPPDYRVERLDDDLDHRILTGSYPRWSPGIDQRLASKRGFIVRIAEPEGAIPERDSDWIVA